MEALLLLAMLGQRWAMSHDPRHRIELVPHPFDHKSPAMSQPKNWRPTWWAAVITE